MLLDLESVKAKADLLALAERDTTLKRKGAKAKEYCGPCPICGGAKTDGFVVQPEAGRWLCRKCTAGKWRTVIDYVALRDNLDPHDHEQLAEICRRALGSEPPTTGSRAARPARYIQPAAAPPGEQWQRAALALVDACEAALWAPGGARALAYLHKRGLTDSTIKRYRLGYNPETCWAPAEDWGRPGDSDNPIYLPRGITIPCLVRGEAWYIKIRQPKGEPKYIQPRGSRPAIFGADDLIGADLAIFTEGEIDAMTLYQAMGDFAACATLGASTNLPDLATFGVYLRGGKTFLEVYDNDQAGEAGAGRLADLVPSITRCILPAGVKDVNEYHQAGGDLYQWVKPYLPGVPCDWRAWAASVGANVYEYGKALLDLAEKANAAGDLATFSRAWASGMIELGEDTEQWATWAEEEYQVPAAELRSFAGVIA